MAVGCLFLLAVSEIQLLFCHVALVKCKCFVVDLGSFSAHGVLLAFFIFLGIRLCNACVCAEQQKHQLSLICQQPSASTPPKKFGDLKKLVLIKVL